MSDGDARPRHAQAQHRDEGTRRSERPHVPGLAARKAAARLLAAVIDARTPLDGLTDHEHGHPQFRALDLRDRGAGARHPGHGAALPRAPSRLLSRAAGPAAAGQRNGAVAHPPCRGGADPVPRHSRQRRRRPRRHPCQGRSAHARVSPAWSMRVLRELARAKEAELPPMLAATDRRAGLVRRAAARRLWRGEAPTGSSPRIGSRRRSISRSRSDPDAGPNELGGIVLPTGIGARRAACRLRCRTARLRRGRVVGAGRRRRAAGAAVRRCRGQARRRPLRRARRQDRAACAAGAKVTAVDTSANRLARLAGQSRAAAARRRDRRGRHPRIRAARRCSTPSCSTRPAPRPARSAAIPTCLDQDRRPTSTSSPSCSAACSTAP